MSHRTGEASRLVGIHSADANGHQKCGQLIIGPASVRRGFDEGVDFFLVQGMTVAFFSDNVNGAHDRPRIAVSQSRCIIPGKHAVVKPLDPIESWKEASLTWDHL